MSGNQQQARRGSSRTHAVLQEHGQQRSGDVFGLVFCRPFQVAGWGEGKVWAMGRIAGRSAPKSSLNPPYTKSSRPEGEPLREMENSDGIVRFVGGRAVGGKPP